MHTTQSSPTSMTCGSNWSVPENMVSSLISLTGLPGLGGMPGGQTPFGGLGGTTGVAETKHTSLLIKRHNML